MPPRFGVLDVKSRAAWAPFIDGYGTEPWLLKQAKILNLVHEIDDLSADHLLPPAMHPVIPAYATLTVIAYPGESGRRIFDRGSSRDGPRRRSPARIRAAQLRR